MNTLTRLVLFATLLAAWPAHAVKVAYTYDVAGRLTAVNYNGTSRTAFGYDKNGNMLSRTNTVTPVSSPPASLAATYSGLVTNGTPAANNEGTITLKLLPAGSFTGKVVIAGVSYSFAGAFAADGSTPDIAIAHTNLTLHLALNVKSATAQVSGTITDSVALFSSDLTLDPSLYNTTSNPLPAGLIGKYTAIFLPTEGDPLPQGTGYATGAVSNAGVMTLAGKLPTNTTITYSAAIVGVGSMPVFIPLNAHAGFISGNAIFSHQPGQFDFRGTVDWLKPVTTGAYHHDGFHTSEVFLGSRYIAPTLGHRALDFPNTVPNATFSTYGGGLPLNLGLAITLDTKNKFIIPVDAHALKLTITTSSGALIGSFKDGSITRAVGGVLYQVANYADGFFPGDTASGHAYISSP